MNRRDMLKVSRVLGGALLLSAKDAVARSRLE